MTMGFVDHFVKTSRTIAITTNLNTAEEIKDGGFIMVKKQLFKLNIKNILYTSLVTLACTISSNSLSSL